MKNNRFLASLLAAVLCSPLASAGNETINSPNAMYKPTDYAQYLGLNNQQYIKLFAAMQANPEAKVGFKYESIRDKPAFIEMISLLESGETVPTKLQNEVESLFRTNLDNLAEFIEVPKSHIGMVVNKYSELVNTVSFLEDIKLAREKGQSFTTLDAIEVIVITAPEDSIRTTSSGAYTLYTSQIWDFGIEVGGGSQVSVSTTFVNSANGATFGTQKWTVNRFGAAPAENLVCVSSDCKLSPL